MIAAFSDAQAQLDSRLKLGMTSNMALAELRPALVALGFEIEAGKTRNTAASSCTSVTGHFEHLAK